MTLSYPYEDLTFVLSVGGYDFQTHPVGRYNSPCGRICTRPQHIRDQDHRTLYHQRATSAGDSRSPFTALRPAHRLTAAKQKHTFDNIYEVFNTYKIC